MLADRRLREDSRTYDQGAFGNATVILSGPGFRVKLSRDRGDSQADVAIAADPDTWYPLEWVVAAVTDAVPPVPRIMSPLSAAALLERHFDEIQAGVQGSAAHQTEQTLRRFAGQRMDELRDEA